MSNIISRDEWRRRYAARLVSAVGLAQGAAEQAASTAAELADEWLTPEDAADEEATYWNEGE